MKAVITGDIVNSREAESPNDWLNALKDELDHLGTRPVTWEIFRGDSFQVLISDPRSAFHAAMALKSRIRQFKKLDIRMGIGIGKADLISERVTESQGPVFSRSGDAFEMVSQKKERLFILTGEENLDNTLNLLFRWISLSTDHWTQGSAEMMWHVLHNPDTLQTEWAKKLGIRQSSVSERYRRAHVDEILDTDMYFREQINSLTLRS